MQFDKAPTFIIYGSTCSFGLFPAGDYFWHREVHKKLVSHDSDYNGSSLPVHPRPTTINFERAIWLLKTFLFGCWKCCC